MTDLELHEKNRIILAVHKEIAALKELLNKECRYIESDHREWMQLACTPGVAWHEKTILKRKYIFCPYCGGKLREGGEMSERDKWIYELGQRHPNLLFEVSDAYIERRGKDKAEIDKLKKLIPVWVSVDERLPNEEGYYLLYHPDWSVETGLFYQGQLGTIGLTYDSPTHWMPIPLVPRKVAK